MRCSCATSRWDPASATKATGVASFDPWKPMEARPSSPSAPSRRKKSTDRRTSYEPAEAGDTERQSAGSDARTFCARGLENHARLAGVRALGLRGGDLLLVC